MVCWAVPTLAALVLFIYRKTKNLKSMKDLNILLFGATIFGVIDHIWNGEIFLISENLISDIMLGITITIGVFAMWTIFKIYEEISEKKTTADS